MVVGAALIIELATRLCIERMMHQSINMVIFRALTLPLLKLCEVDGVVLAGFGCCCFCVLDTHFYIGYSTQNSYVGSTQFCTENESSQMEVKYRGNPIRVGLPIL